jgi:hypothetical protein
MSRDGEYIVRINTKEVSLTRALKYLDKPEKCQRKLDLTLKEYKKLVHIIKHMAAGAGHATPPPPTPTINPTPPPTPTINPTPPPTPTIKPSGNNKPSAQWYDMIAATTVKDEQRNNAALLERRFLNTEHRPWVPIIGTGSSNGFTSPNKTSAALAGRIFDIVNPEMPAILPAFPLSSSLKMNVTN